MENLDEVDEIDGTYGGPYMVEKILGIYVGKNRKKYYRVKWVDSWEPEDNLSEACQPLIDEFWSSPIHDTTGGEINRTDLKSGQKIIKKETKSSSDDSNPDSPEDAPSTLRSNVMPTLKSDLGSPKHIGQVPVFPSNPKNLKQELMSPTADMVNKVNSTSKNAKTSTSDENTNISFPAKRTTIDSCLQTESPIPATQIKKTLSSQSVSTKSTACTSVKRKSVDCQTQTSDNEDEYIVMSTTPDTHNTIQTSCGSTQTDTPVLTTTTEQIQEIDLPSDELSFSESDVVDLASEEENDVEITLSTPSKRQCPEKKKHPASTSGVERRSRVKITQRRRRNSDGEASSQTRPPLHPRSLLPIMPGSAPESNRKNPATLASQVNFQLHQPPNISGRKRPLNLPTRTPERHSSPTNKVLNVTNKLTDRTCNICKHTFPNLTLARQHVKKVHVSSATPTTATPTTPTPTTPNRVVRNAPVVLNQKNTSTTANQQRSLQNVPELTCNVCFAFFRNNRDLKSHMLLHTEKNLQKCEICLRTFKNKTTLHQHMLIHSDELPHECQTCGKRFRQQGHLILHMGKHTQNNEGTLVCPHCSTEYSDINEFRNHVRSHESELPFKCSQCLERFSQRNDLMRHLEGHNEGRPFTCSICKKSFKTKPYLLGHMQMHKMRNNESNPQPRQQQSQETGHFIVKTDS